MDQQEKERQRQSEPEHTTVEHTSPIWRVAAVALTAGFVAALGFWLDRIGLGQDFATIVVVTAVYSTIYWARKRPDRLRRRFGPFGKIADAIRESLDDINQYIFDRPMRVGIVFAASYGIALVLAKHVVVAILGALYSWELALALGCIVGAVAAAPHLFRSLGDRIAGPPERRDEPDEDEPEEPTEDCDENADDSENQGRNDG